MGSVPILTNLVGSDQCSSWSSPTPHRSGTMQRRSLPALVAWLLVVASADAWSGDLASRRDLLHSTAVSTATAAATLGWPTPPCQAAALVTEDTSPNPDELPLPSNPNVRIPRVGYSLYKTDPSQAAPCVGLALDAGVRHFDVATQYGSNANVGEALTPHLQISHRRRDLFVTHKLSNDEQSTNRKLVKQRVKQQLAKLQYGDYLDMCMVHSPLTTRRKRLTTYEALLELQHEGVVRAVGVCHFGVNPLHEIVDAGLSAPAVVQLVLSPFHQHKDVAKWAEQHNSVLSCNAWSKLSSVSGPQDGWAVVGGIAKKKGVTKAQVLVRWALQSNYLCVPRSASTSKMERQAIFENSYNGVQGFVLSHEEMQTLNGLDEQLPAGRLGVLDGWTERDIVDDTWDPTTAV